jgi:hypothetical protein
MPLPNDDEEARKSRAARLREQIDGLTSGKPPAEKTQAEPPKSARDLIHEKMTKQSRDRKGAS